MPYLVDSDIVIYYSNEAPEIERMLDRLMDEGVAISTVTLMEVLAGMSSSPRPLEARTRIEEFARAVPVVAFGEAEARRCAMLRQVLQRQGMRVRSRLMDLMIAATALEHGLTLATNNQSDFRGIPGLLIETP